MYKDYREPNGIDDIQKRIREQMEADFQRRMKTGFAVPLGGERPTSADEFFGTQSKMPDIFSAPPSKEVTDSFMPKAEGGGKAQVFAQALSALSKTADSQQPAPNFQLAPGMIAPPRQITMPQMRPYPTLPRYEQGGYVPPGGQAIVGDNRFGNRKKEERIVALPDGGVQVIPVEGMTYGDVAKQYPDGGAAFRGNVPDDVPLPTTPITTEVGQRPLIPQVQQAEKPVDTKGTIFGKAPNHPEFQRTPDPPEPSKLDKLYEERERIVGGLDEEGKPIKTNKWLSGLFTALQGIEKIWQPNNKPILSLEEARMQAKLGKIDPQIAAQEKKRDADLDRRVKIAQAKNLEDQPYSREAERQRKIDADKRKSEFNEKTFHWKQEDRDKWWEAEEEKNAARLRNDERTYQLALRRQEALEQKNRDTVETAERRIYANPKSLPLPPRSSTKKIRPKSDPLGIFK